MVRLTMMVVLLVGCSAKPEDALSLLQSHGLSDIQMLPSKPLSWSDCYQGKGFAFRATDKSLDAGKFGEGRLVVGMVCCSMRDCDIKQDAAAIKAERANMAVQASMKGPGGATAQQASGEH